MEGGGSGLADNNISIWVLTITLYHLLTKKQCYLLIPDVNTVLHLKKGFVVHCCRVNIPTD